VRRLGVSITRQNATVARRAVTAGVVVLYVVAWALISAALKTTPSDLDLFFWPSAQTVVAGHPLLIYAGHLHDAYPNANGPLGLVPLVPIAALANALGWAGNLAIRAAIAGSMVSIFVLLLAYQAVRLVEQARGSAGGRLGVACAILLAPAMWIAVIDFGHIEQPLELCLVLLGVTLTASDRPLAGGISFGLAVLARTIAVFCVIPFVLLPIATRRISPAALTAIAAVLTVAVCLLPFVVADRPDIVHSLVTYRGSLPIGGGSFWVLARHTGLANLAQYGDVACAVVAAAALVAITLRRRPAVATTSTGLLGLLTISASCFPLFAKSVFPYYFLEPYVVGAIWWLARPGSARNWRVLVPLLLTAGMFLSEAAVSLPIGGLAPAEGVLSSAIVAVVIGMVTVDLCSTRSSVGNASTLLLSLLR
jgi:hypothetical protein